MHVVFDYKDGYVVIKRWFESDRIIAGSTLSEREANRASRILIGLQVYEKTPALSSHKEANEWVSMLIEKVRIGRYEVKQQ